MKRRDNLFTVVNHLLFRNSRQRWLFCFVLLTITLTAVGAAIFPVLFSWGVDSLTTAGANINTGVKYIIAFGLGLTLVGVLEQIQWLTFGPLNLALQRYLTIHVFRHALSLPYYRLKDYTTYEIGRSVEHGLNAVHEIVSKLTFSLIPTIIELIIAASVIAFMVNGWIALFMIVALCLYGVIANIAACKIRLATEIAMDTGNEAWRFGLDGVANAELVQQSGKVEKFTTYLNEKLKTNNRDWALTFKLRSYFGVLQALLFGAVVTGVLWSGALGVAQETLTIGSLVLLNTYIIRLLQPLETFAEVYREVNAFIGEAQLLMQMLAIPVPQKTHIPDNIGNNPVSLELRQITLAIDERPILQNLSFSVPAGGQLFIVGPSGVGKSSLLKLLSCLTVAQAGEYYIAGQLINEENAPCFRSHISVVQQDCLVFDWSVRENIAFGVEASAQEIEAVIAQLGLDSVINNMAKNNTPADEAAIDTAIIDETTVDTAITDKAITDEATVGERGSRLSGGERQRLSLARSLLAKPQLLLLDEPTASLDEGNRQRVIESIEKLKKSCTLIFVTHDITLLQPASKVLFLLSAQQHALATHAELLAENPAYQRFISGILTEK